MDWTAVGALAGGVGGTIALGQLRQARKAAQVQAYFAILEALQVEETREARHHLLGLADKPYADWTNVDKRMAGRALNPYASIAEMVAMRLLPITFVRVWADSITACRSAGDEYLANRRTIQPQLWSELDMLCGRLHKPGWHERLLWRIRFPSRPFPASRERRRP